MQDKIILFSIGGVQDFIINSRKVCDLCSGSEILSTLITKAINYTEDFQGELLLPQVLDIDNNKNIPNYFIMMYKSSDFIGQKIEQYIREEYEQMFKNLFECKELNNYYKVLINHEEQIRDQLNSSLDIYWVELELQKDFDRTNWSVYEKVYNELYENLEAIKNIKKFKSICEEGKKCSICGIRNALISNKDNYRMQHYYTYKCNNKEFKENSLFKLIDRVEQEIERKLHIDDINRIKSLGEKNYIKVKSNTIKDNEEICLACLIKRFYNKGKKVSSTAKVSLEKWIEKNINLNKTDYYEYKRLVSDKCQENGLDLYQCMYKENWNDFLKNDVKREEYIKKLERCFDKIKNKKLPKYYCVYRMDIDNLGKWMSGKYKTSRNDNFYLYQKNLSINIARFFDKVKQYFINEYNGILIYAGGDDLLALIPVDGIYEFQKVIDDNFKNEISKTEYKEITYSQGIFITHYKAPLGEIIRVSKDELERVKEIFKHKRSDMDKEKNATILSIMTKGYHSRSVYFKNYIKNELFMDFIWNVLIKYFNKENSSYFHDQLEIEFLEIINNIKEYEIDYLLAMFETEQLRLMKRSSVNDDEKSLELINNINSKLKEFLLINSDQKQILDFKNYFDLFNIIRGLNSIMMGE